MNDMEKISLLYGVLDEDQKIEIKTGIKNGLDVMCYAKTEYMAIQMRQIRLGLQEGLDVSVYCKPEYDWFQMEEIRLGMEAGLNYKMYADASIDYQRMRQIRKGLKDGIDLSRFIRLEAGILEELRKALKAKVAIVDYIKEGYAVEQLEQIRIALEKKIKIAPYISVDFRGPAIREICLGLEAGLPVETYAKLELDWQQMREIRLGMERRVEVGLYSNDLFSWQQMREIRLGLQEGLEVDSYRKFIYTAVDMKRIREKLLEEFHGEGADSGEKQQILDEQISIFVSRDEMEACIQVESNEKITKNDIIKKLKQSGITQGILTDEIEDLIRDKKYGHTIVVAKGKAAQKGEDGRYEYFFDTNPQRKPKILADGSADFKDIKWFEIVEKGQKVAYYHSAGFGVAGYTVTGKFLKPLKGKEKPVLRGKGFILEEDGKTYTAAENGKITVRPDVRLDISKICVVNNVNLATGNISFDGTIYVKGNVGSGVYVSAMENVIVDGYVENAIIKSGGEVFLRRGVNGQGHGIIEAKENVVGQFFEEVTVIAGQNIEGQYCLNSDLHSKGNVVMHGSRGLILGGKVRATKEISAYTIGNKTGIRTALQVGVGHEVFKLQQKIYTDIEGVIRELTILQHTQKNFQNKYAPEVRNTMEIYLKIENAIYTKELQLKSLTEDKEKIEEQLSSIEEAQIVVQDVLYEGTEVTVDEVKWRAFSVKDVVIRCENGKIVVE